MQKPIVATRDSDGWNFLGAIHENTDVRYWVQSKDGNVSEDPMSIQIAQPYFMLRKIRNTAWQVFNEFYFDFELPLNWEVL